MGVLGLEDKERKGQVNGDPPVFPIEVTPRPKAGHGFPGTYSPTYLCARVRISVTLKRRGVLDYGQPFGTYKPS